MRSLLCLAFLTSAALAADTHKLTRVYEKLTTAGVEVLYDDRGERPGEQFADADLMGLPTRLVVSTSSLEKGGVELKERSQKDSKILSADAVIQALAKP